MFAGRPALLVAFSGRPGGINRASDFLGNARF